MKKITFRKSWVNTIYNSVEYDVPYLESEIVESEYFFIKLNDLHFTEYPYFFQFVEEEETVKNELNYLGNYYEEVKGNTFEDLFTYYSFLDIKLDDFIVIEIEEEDEEIINTIYLLSNEKMEQLQEWVHFVK